jgi:hypothetical protein
LAAATTAAQQVVVADGLPASDLAMAYLDAGGAPTTTPSLVRTVGATVTDARRTMFLSVLGIATTQVAAAAQVAGGGGGGGAVAPCALCAMSASITGITLGGNAQLTVSGAPLIINSTADPNVYVGSGAVLSAPSIVEVGSNEQNSGTITPGANSGSPVGDPHSTAPVPSVAGSAVSYTAPAGSPSIAPGVYSQITVGTGANLTLGAGVYVLTGPVNMSGGSIIGSGVMIYLACSAYPIACASGGSGARFNITGGTLTLSPPTSGTYAGMTVFADRNNGATTIFSNAAVTITGTWYTINMPLLEIHPGDTVNLGETDAALVAIADSTTLNVTYVRSQSYGGGSGGGPLSLSL